MQFLNQDPELIQSIFRKTRVLRKPITGIVSGYHDLPYILVGPDQGSTNASIEICGQINVSPRLVLSNYMPESTYGDIFGQEPEEIMEKKIFGRVFSFLYTRKHNVKLENLKFEINRRQSDPREQLDRVQDRLDRTETINTGVIFSPDTRYYPVSIDRFINDILDKEFGA